MSSMADRKKGELGVGEVRRVGLAAPDLSGHESTYLRECIETGWVSSKGRFVTDFEREFSRWIGVRFSSAVSNGTAALHLALAALGVGPGDEVILPSFTMIACANVARFLGASPVLVDSDKQEWNADPDAIAKAVTPRTKAIMAVHLYGHPVDMGPVLETSHKFGIPIVEDAAEAHGAEYRGKKTGSLGDIGAFSFYANKVLTTGEGGMVVSNNAELDERVRSLRDQGYDQRHREWLVHDRIGYNYRMTNMQAALGLAQLERVDHFLEVHRSNASRYSSALRSFPGVTLPPAERLTRDVHWMYSILIDSRGFGLSRDEVMKRLKARGIDSRATFLPIHRQPPYKSQFREGVFPVAEWLGETGINLPSGNATTREEVDYVIDTLYSLREGERD
jgi:perosamine synthetase